MPLASRSRPSIPASRAWRTRKSGWSLSSRCGRPARDGPPRVGSLPRLSSAWPADVPCVCGMVAGREMGEVAAEEGAAEATAAGAGAAAGARVNHRPIRWEDAGRDRPAPEQGIHTGPSSQQPMRPATTPEAPPARTGLPSGWAGRPCRSGGEAGCGGALAPAHRRRPRSLRTAQVSEGEGAIAAAVSRARGEADSPRGVLVEMSTQPRLPAYEALTRSPTPRTPYTQAPTQPTPQGADAKAMLTMVCSVWLAVHF